MKEIDEFSSIPDEKLGELYNALESGEVVICKEYSSPLEVIVLSKPVQVGGIKPGKSNQILQSILSKYGEALVFMGAGGPAEDWMNGIAKIFLEEGITSEADPSKIWKTNITLQIRKDRSDLVLPFTEVLDLQKLALWRIRNRNIYGVMWLSDYITNPGVREDGSE